MLFLIWFIILLIALVFYLRETYSKWNRIGLKHLPIVPIFGDMTWVLLRQEHLVDVFQKIFKRFPDEKFVGRYEFLRPNLVLKDIELVKKVTVKDFEHFVDRRNDVDKVTDPLFARNLLSLKGDEWKGMRSALSPAFTSSKIRQMVPFMVQVGDQMIKSLKSKIQQSGDDYIDLDIKELTTRYANDVIATCAFGLDINSQFEDNTFYNMSKETSTFPFTRILKFLLIMNASKLAKFLKIRMFRKKLQDFYFDVVLGAIKQREENKIYRPDMIQLLIEAKKGQLSYDAENNKDETAGFATVEESDIGRKKSKHKWSDADLVAQAVIFLFAGFDTVSTTMSFLLYELAVNPEVQDTLVREIKTNEEKNGGNFDYHSIQHMSYLDCIVSETLRKWPSVPATDRYCVKDYNLGKPNSKASQDIIIRKGDNVQIPIWSFHHNPQFFPNPKKFDPERFSEDNKHTVNPFSYMPFGVGPRNCIGSRFALCEIKVMVYQLLQLMEVVPYEKTRIPLQLAKNGFSMTPEGGNWLRLRIRK